MIIDRMPLGKPYIIEDYANGPNGNGAVCYIYYGPDHERWETSDGYYFGDYEERFTSYNSTQHTSYTCLDGGVLCVTSPSGTHQFYYMQRDHIGSIFEIITATGSSVFTASYDPWGKQDIMHNDIGFYRGFTGHEMMPEFGLINMNGRLYDPVSARFLSPDNFVQQPWNSQNFNRYSYCLNNPLKYNDPSGEWFGLDDLLVAGAGFLAGYVSNGISSGNWGWKSVQSGLTTAVSSWLGYNTAGLSSASGAITSSTWNSIGGLALNTAVNSLFPSMTIPISNHFSYSISPSFAFGDSGLMAGMFSSINYADGDFSLSVGFGGGNQFTGWNVYAKNNRWGLGYTRTHFSEANVKGNVLDNQYVGTFTLGHGRNFLLNWTNDRFATFKGDFGRTSAVELSFKKFTIGTFVTTNNGAKASKRDMQNLKDPLLGYNPYKEIKGEMIGGGWPNGKVYSAPLWVGYRHGNQIQRIGFSHPYVQILTQNAVHRYIIKTPYFLDYSRFYTGFYSYYGYNNPLSVW